MVLTGNLGNLCIACGVMFSSIEGRLKHEKASHSRIELTCNECPFVALGANGEFGETCHSTTKRFEKLKGYIRNRNLSSDNALKTAHKSHSNFIALKMGSPSRSLAIRSPRSSASSSPVRSRDQYLPVQKSF